MADPVEAIAEELYRLPPRSFVAARDARAAELHADKALAARVKELRRAAPAAWIVTLLVHARRDALDELFDLGAELRAAQSALDRAAITRLAAERRTAVRALARDGGELAEAAGHRATTAILDAVAATLDAGLADPEAADAILTGRLLRPLETIGFEPVDLAEAIALPEAGSRSATRRVVEKPRLRVVDDADAELTRARTRADAAVARAERSVDEAAAELRRTEERVREARRVLAAAEREAAGAEQARDAAGRVHGAAIDAADAARRARRELG